MIGGADNSEMSWFYTMAAQHDEHADSYGEKARRGFMSSAIYDRRRGGYRVDHLPALRFFLDAASAGAGTPVNPIMQSYWFSIFRADGKLRPSISGTAQAHIFPRLRILHRLIVGELALVMPSVAVSPITGHNINIDLNRN